MGHWTPEMLQWARENANRKCKCGCGKVVKPSRWRWYNGKNLDYVTGHNPSSHGHLRNEGKYSNEQGYILVLCPDHPHADSRGYVREHRLVMEQILGRHLEPSEHVHHINCVKWDNRPENLEVMDKSEHHLHHARYGQNHPKWVDVDVQKLRDLHQQELSYEQMAEQLGISRTTVYRRLKQEGLI